MGRNKNINMFRTHQVKKKECDLLLRQEFKKQPDDQIIVFEPNRCLFNTS